jgi:outer membrane protein assembly factor BamB
MRKRCAWCLSLVLPAAAVLAAVGRGAFEPKPFDWPQWRGPDRSDVCRETGLLKTWPRGGPPLAWKVKGLGQGYSSPSIAAGRIFVSGKQGNDEVVLALNEADGKELWKTVIASSTPRVDRGEGPRGTPTVDGTRLYALAVNGELACLEAATGKLVWRKSFAKDFGGRMPKWGYSESPLVDGDHVICTPGGPGAALAALDKKTGAVVWKAAVPQGGGAAYSSAVATEAGGVRLYVQLLARGLVGVAAKDGRFLFHYGKIANGVANIPTAIVRGDLVFCSTGYQTGSALLKLVPSDAGLKAEEQYFLAGKVLQNHHGGMVLLGDYLYGGHGHKQGIPVCVEFKTGKVVWRQDRAPGSGSAAVLAADGNLYFRYENGTMALIEMTPKGYRARGTFDPPDNSGQPSWSHPVIANGKLYLRDQDVLLCYDVKQH